MTCCDGLSELLQKSQTIPSHFKPVFTSATRALGHLLSFASWVLGDASVRNLCTCRLALVWPVQQGGASCVGRRKAPLFVWSQRRRVHAYPVDTRWTLRVLSVTFALLLSKRRNRPFLRATSPGIAPLVNLQPTSRRERRCPSRCCRLLLPLAAMTTQGLSAALTVFFSSRVIAFRPVKWREAHLSITIASSTPFLNCGNTTSCILNADFQLLSINQFQVQLLVC